MPARALVDVAIGVALVASACDCDRREPAKLLAPGALAPEVVGEGANGEVVRLSERTGKPAVVYFYPKDDTPGCTKEACAFRDAYDRYTQAGITIFGVSRDDTDSHRAFRAKHHIPFPLVADVDGKVQAAYGVPSRLGMASRVTFLVGRDGKIARVFPDVDPAIHAAEVLAAVPTVSPSPPDEPPTDEAAPPSRAPTVAGLRERARGAVGIDVALTPPLPTKWPSDDREVAFLAHRVEPLPTGVVRYHVSGPTHRIVVPVRNGSVASTPLASADDDRGVAEDPGSSVPDAAQQALVDVISGSLTLDGARAELAPYCTWLRSGDPRALDARQAVETFFAWLGC